MSGLGIVAKEMLADKRHAWSIFCNIVTPIAEGARVSYKVANEAAAHLMQHLFSYDITAHPKYDISQFGSEKDLRDKIEIAENALREIRKGAVIYSDPYLAGHLGKIASQALIEMESEA